MKSIDIQSPEEINLDIHGLIEASAGTGKTYTIENMVVSLLGKEKPGGGLRSLEEILVVTFTEKATAELKVRIRQKIESAIEELSSGRPAGKDAKKLANLTIALDNFDTASIFTIHGFCQRLLTHYAFENGGPFTAEVVDDGEIYQRMLIHQMRESWPQQYGADLEFFLSLSGFSRDGNWEARIIEVARKYRPRCDDVLVPGPDFSISRESVENKLKKFISEISDSLLFRNDAPGEAELYHQYQDLKMHGSSRKSINDKIFGPLFSLLSDEKGEGALYERVSGYIDICETSGPFKDSGFSLLREKLKEPEEIDEKCPGLPALVKLLEGLRTFIQSLKAQLTVNTVVRLKEDVARYKREQGCMSYDDMLVFVYDALRQGRLLLQSVRQHYSVALVDEFQDTDPIQWSIFRTIFLESQQHRLFLIGDPKQAIYSFRGADIYAYLEAKEEIAERARNGKACIYTLSRNWRSLPGMIDAFNRFFEASAGSPWFGTSLEYINSLAPADDERKCRIFADDSGRPNLTFLDLKGAANARTAKKNLARMMADEIDYLVNQVHIEIGSPERCRALNAGDICVLVRARTEVPILEAALAEKGISYSFYKKPGLYQSDEALYLGYLLAAIAGPSDPAAVKRALLTDFFRIEACQLKAYDALPPGHPVRELFARWEILARERNWPILFQSIIEDTTLFYYETSYHDRERRITNYQHILQELEVAAQQGNSDIRQLSELLNNRIIQSITVDEESDLHRLETEDPRVQIMTIHASKGLEFPVVFLGGGLTVRTAGPSYYTVHRDHKKVFDFCKSRENFIRYKSEEDDEFRRIFYVALTRASHKLYVPFYRPKIRTGSGPVTRFIYDRIETAWAGGTEKHPALFLNHLRKPVKEVGMDSLSQPDMKPENITELETFEEIVLPAPLLPDEQYSFRERNIRIGSFSGMSRRFNTDDENDRLRRMISIDPDAYGLYSDKMDDAPEVTLVSEEAGAELLPPGRNAGLILHEILEVLDFTRVSEFADYRQFMNDADITELIRLKMERYPLTVPGMDSGLSGRNSAFAGEIARMVYNALSVPLDPAGRYNMSLSGVPLCEVPVSNCLPEVEFHYPISTGCDDSGTDDVCNGFCTGIIDLVFRSPGAHEIFFLDWKSNYLEEGYAPSVVAADMMKHKYILQYKLYAIAIRRWMAVHGLEFDENFGGIIYVYLRGRNFETPENGIYFDKPDNKMIDIYEEDVREFF